ncbi:DUF411 domain-containing protein [Pararhodobacter sp.]
MIGRRGFLGLGAAALALPAWAQRGVRAEVWRDPNCGCCGGWIAHLRTEGFSVTDHRVASVGAYRQRLGTPSDLLSCHAALVEGLVIEGHVPAFAIRRALAERPEGVVGLAVPAMPLGTPGMEIEGVAPEVYDVIAWRADGSHFPWLRMRGADPV